MLYCMGHDVEETLASNDRVLAQFDSFFTVQRNVIFERAKFNRKTQWRSEFVEQFLTALYHLVKMCEYGALHDEMLRDLIVKLGSFT